MNKGLLLILAVAAIVIIVAGAFFFKKPQTTSQTNQPSDSSMVATDNSSDNKFSGTFLELLALGQNYSCTYRTTDSTGSQMSGMAYVAGAGKKINGQFTLTQADGTTMDSNFISDGEYNYIWTSAQKQGIRIKVGANDNSLFGSDSDSEKSTGISDQDKVDFDCKPWTVDNSMFIPPADMEYVDLSEMMQMQPTSAAMQEGGESDTATPDCSVCNQIPEGPSKTQCLQSLGC
jgi:hypothetical protein